MPPTCLLSSCFVGESGLKILNALTKLHQSPSPVLRILVAALLLALAGAGAFAVTAHKTVTLDVDGAQMKVTTMKSRVLDIVQENGFSVADRDDLFPAADQTVHDAETIVLRRSRPLQISLDGQDTKQVWTTASTVDEALNQLSMTDTAPAAASARQPAAAGGDGPAGGQRQDGADQRRWRGQHGASGRAQRRGAAGRRRCCRCSRATPWCRRRRRR